ncbi:hypothetical protein [Streptomyces sp. NPDC094468]|uniref:hypothetical protein n=1 Tax=Streptomyces sp. NPDC094468 TaxID=3366066 RepID=UPI0037F3DEF3
MVVYDGRRVVAHHGRLSGRDESRLVLDNYDDVVPPLFGTLVFGSGAIEDSARKQCPGRIRGEGGPETRVARPRLPLTPVTPMGVSPEHHCTSRLRAALR